MPSTGHCSVVHLVRNVRCTHRARELRVNDGRSNHILEMIKFLMSKRSNIQTGIKLSLIFFNIIFNIIV